MLKATADQANVVSTQQGFGPNESYESANKDKLPKRAEMLGILSRYETGLMNAVMRTLSLLRGLQSARADADKATRTIQG